jgi:hypothetical protein
MILLPLNEFTMRNNLHTVAVLIDVEAERFFAVVEDKF